MNSIIYLIKNKNGFPRIFAEVYSGEELLVEYEINLMQDIDKLELSIIQEYSNSLKNAFDEIISDIKSDGLNSNSFSIRIAIITELLKVKTQCDEYIQRMDIIE